eukprot:7377470-Prymnesium_polylepis.3
MIRVHIEYTGRQVVLALLCCLLLLDERLTMERVLGHHLRLELVKQLDDRALDALPQQLFLIASRHPLLACPRHGTALDALPLDLRQPDLVDAGSQLAISVQQLFAQPFAPKLLESALRAILHCTLTFGITNRAAADKLVDHHLLALQLADAHEFCEQRFARRGSALAVRVVISTVDSASREQRSKVAGGKAQGVLVAEEILAPLAEARHSIAKDGIPGLQLLEPSEADVALILGISPQVSVIDGLQPGHHNQCLSLDVHMRREPLATHVARVRARRTLGVVRIQHPCTQILAVRKAGRLAWRRP